MDISQLQTFLKVVQLGSFTQVAEIESRTQRSVSRQMTTLEEAIGTTLFNREINKITLTGQGKIFYASAQDIVKNYKVALNALENNKNELANYLNVGYFSAFEKPLLQSALLETCAINHDNQLRITQESNENLFQGVSDGRLGFALLTNYGISPIHHDSLIKAVSVYSDEMVLGISKLNPLSEKPGINDRDLEGQNIIYLSPESSTYLLETFLANTPFLNNPDKISRVGSVEQLNLLVSLDQTMAFYPHGLIGNMPNLGAIEYVPLITDNNLKYDVIMLYNPENKKPLLKELIKQFTI